jgi:hypothetical protein
MVHDVGFADECVPNVAHAVGEGDGAVELVGDVLWGDVVEGNGVWDGRT